MGGEVVAASELLTKATGLDMGGGGGYIPGEQQEGDLQAQVQVHSKVRYTNKGKGKCTAYSRYASSVPEGQFWLELQEHVVLQEVLPRHVVVNRVLVLAHNRYIVQLSLTCQVLVAAGFLGRPESQSH